MYSNKCSNSEPFPVNSQQNQIDNCVPRDLQELDVGFDYNTFDAVNDILGKATTRSSGGLGNAVIRNM